MAGMGQNGTINITPEMMDEAIKAIATYRTSAESLQYNFMEICNSFSLNFFIF